MLRLLTPEDERLGNGTFRITTRQGFQLHGVVKGNLWAAIHEINEALLTTLAACGDVERNVMCCPAPHHNDRVMQVVFAPRGAPAPAVGGASVHSGRTGHSQPIAILTAARHRGLMPRSSPAALAGNPTASEALEPRVRWSQLTEAPLAGLALAREARRILAWDDAHNIYVLDLAGRQLLSTRAPVPLHLAAISDDGKQLVVTSREGDIWWLGDKLAPRVHRPGHRNLIGLAISAQGEYLAAGLNDSHTRIYDWHGRPVTNLLTHRPLKHVAFLVGQPYLVAAAEYGLAGCYELDGQPRWQDSLWSSAGHLSASGNGYAILISCFGHGLQRYGLDGTNEGAYHLGGGVARASLDYDGKLIAAATLEGELIVLNAVGHVLWRQKLAKPAKEVLLDAAGQFLVYGQETGEYTVLDLLPSAFTKQSQPERAEPTAARQPASATPVVLAPTAPPETAPDTGGPARQLRSPTWKVAVFDNEAQAETAVLALVDDPTRVLVFSNRKRIEVFDEHGDRTHRGDVMTGVGRNLEADSGMVVATTDRDVAVYDVAANSSSRFPNRLVQISHVAIDSAAGEIVLVEERDRLDRFDLSGRRRWVSTIDNSVETLAIGMNRTSAVTTDNGQLLIFDADGRQVGEFHTVQPEPLAVVRLGSQWVTLAGKSQLVRGHQADGVIAWETTLPTEAWRLIRTGNRVIARAAGGRSYVLDAQGLLIVDSTELPHEALLFSDRAGEPLALFWRVGNLMVTDLVGRVRWRHLSTEPIGPVAAGPAGVASTLGRELSFFSA